MPLSDVQEEALRLLAIHRDDESYLAGGAAMNIEPQSTRYSDDLDYFQDSEERVAEAFASDEAALRQAGFSVAVQLSQPGFIRAIASKGGEATRIDWAQDSAWRFLPPVSHPVAGVVLQPIDLAINKLLALVGRDEPRDVVDTLDAHDTILSLGALAWAAAGKDPGYTPPLILEMLGRRATLRSEDLERLHLSRELAATELKSKWLSALAQAKAFVASRPPEEMGCLYLSPSQERFIGDAEELGDAVPHYGRPGGVLPVVHDP